MPGRDGASAAIGDHPPDRNRSLTPGTPTWHGAVHDGQRHVRTSTGIPEPAQPRARRERTPHPWRVIHAAATVARIAGAAGVVLSLVDALEHVPDPRQARGSATAWCRCWYWRRGR